MTVQLFDGQDRTNGIAKSRLHVVSQTEQNRRTYDSDEKTREYQSILIQREPPERNKSEQEQNTDGGADPDPFSLYRSLSHCSSGHDVRGRNGADASPQTGIYQKGGRKNGYDGEPCDSQCQVRRKHKSGQHGGRNYESRNASDVPERADAWSER